MNKTKQYTILLFGIVAGFMLFNCGGSPKLQIVKSHLNLGDVKVADTLLCVFPIVNEGGGSLKIINAKGNCECVSIQWDSTDIKRNDTSYVKVNYVPNAAGNASKIVIIQTNTDPPFSTLTIDATVK